MRNLLRIYRIILFLIFSVFAFIGCRKMLNPQEEPSAIENVSKIKKEFETLKYTDLLSEKINDTRLIKEPQWNLSNESVKDGIVYTYIPLNILGISENGKNLPVAMVGVREYLLAKQKDGGDIELYLSRYIFDSPKQQSLSEFTGSLVTMNLKTSQFEYYSFNNGVRGNFNTAKVATNSITPKTNSICETIYSRTFGSDVCNGVGYYTVTIGIGGYRCPDIALACSGGSGCGPGNVWYTVIDNDHTFQHCIDPPSTPPAPNTAYPYARIEMTNDNNTNWYDGDFYREKRTVDVYLRFYSDAACTTPIGMSSSTILSYDQQTGVINSMGPGNGPQTTWFFVLNSNSSSTEIYLGNLVQREFQSYPDAYYGTVTDEMERSWNAVSGVGCNARPTLWY